MAKRPSTGSGGGMGFRINRNSGLNTSANDPIMALLNKEEDEDEDETDKKENLKLQQNRKPEPIIQVKRPQI